MTSYSTEVELINDYRYMYIYSEKNWSQKTNWTSKLTNNSKGHFLFNFKFQL